MAMNFLKRREALQVEREIAIRSIEPDPTKLVEKALLAPVPISSEEAGTNPSASVLVEVQPQKSKRISILKEKEVVPPIQKTKRIQEVSKAKVPRKKTLQAPVQATATESEGTMTLGAHTFET